MRAVLKVIHHFATADFYTAKACTAGVVEESQGLNIHTDVEYMYRLHMRTRQLLHCGSCAAPQEL